MGGPSSGWNRTPPGSLCASPDNGCSASCSWRPRQRGGGGRSPRTAALLRVGLDGAGGCGHLQEGPQGGAGAAAALDGDGALLEVDVLEFEAGVGVVGLEAEEGDGVALVAVPVDVHV